VVRYERQPKPIDTEAPEGSLRWFYESRYLAERGGCEKNRDFTRRKLRAFCRCLEREPMLSDLNAVTINAYLQTLLTQRLSAWTVQNYKATFRALWQSAFDWELLDKPPARLMRITKPPTMPKAWNRDEYCRLLAACDHPKMNRGRGGINLGRFLRAAIMLNYDTALRFGDLLAAEWRQLGSDGVLTIVMSKTSHPHACAVAPETIEALRRIEQRGDQRLLPWHIDRRRIWRDMKKLREVAGLPTGRGNAFQKLRRTSASHLDADSPGTGTQQLGHRNPTLAAKHYLDPAMRKPRLPPRLTSDAKGGAE
jgi:integrase